MLLKFLPPLFLLFSFNLFQECRAESVSPPPQFDFNGGAVMFSFGNKNILNETVIAEFEGISDLTGKDSWLALSYSLCQDNLTSSYVYPCNNEDYITPSNSDLIEFTALAQEKGLKVFLRPFIFPQNDPSGLLFIAIQPNNVTLWFQSLNNYLIDLVTDFKNNGTTELNSLAIGNENMYLTINATEEVVENFMNTTNGKDKYLIKRGYFN